MPRFYKEIYFFFLKDESFVSKTLNEGHVVLSKFPASPVYKLAKKMESSQATAKHMKQVTRDPQAVQVNLLISCDISAQKYHPVSPRRKIKPPSLDNKPTNSIMKNQDSKKKIEEDLILITEGQTDVQNVVTPSSEKVLDVQQASTNVRFAKNLATSAASVTRRKLACIIKESPLVHPRHIS